MRERQGVSTGLKKKLQAFLPYCGRSLSQKERHLRVGKGGCGRFLINDDRKLQIEGKISGMPLCATKIIRQRWIISEKENLMRIVTPEHPQE